MENVSLAPLREFSRNYRNEILAFEQNIINNLQLELSLTKETSSLKIQYPIEQYTRRGNIIGDVFLSDIEIEKDPMSEFHAKLENLSETSSVWYLKYKTQILIDSVSCVNKVYLNCKDFDLLLKGQYNR